ncbi:Ger(x)C family spore germination protein [Gottfriedia sp. NPDC056225]|uniref:Ger(x)C family spore germination protein n=1 Tax=Gottfriedia sp. NPDC056225 TaxID=3345751 RepID=UPI0015590037|nr:Ger(x)C family spore germination protein [Arthrobacter citreus]
MNRIRKIALIIPLLLFSSGCSNYTELNEISFILGLGIDWSEDSNYKVTLQIISPTDLSTGGTGGGGGNASPVFVYTSTGNTISAAIRDAAKKITRKKDFTHVALTVIGEKAARHGIEEIVDSIIREPRVSAFMSVLVAKDSTAENILNTLTPIKKVAAVAMVSKIQNVNFSLGESVNPNIFQLAENLAYTGKEIAISGVKITDNSKGKNNLTNIQKMTPSQTFIDDLAVFRNNKLIGWLDGRDIRAVLMVQDKIEQSNFSVPCGDNKFTSLRFLEQDIKTEVDVNGNVPVIKIKDILLSLVDETGCKIKLEDVSDLIKLEKEAAKVVKKQIVESIEHAQKYKSDVFGFGDIVHTSNPKKWKAIKNNWPEEFSKAKIDVKVTFIIKRTGLLGNPVNLKRE